MVGDELRLKLGEGSQFLYGKPWEGVGYVKDIIDGEVELELRQSTVHIPDSISEDFVVEYIWKSTSFDRMQNALKTFAIDDTSVTGYIYHKLLGHQVEEQRIASAKLPIKDEDFTVPALPPLNEIQKEAVLNVIQRPLSLIQGPPVSSFMFLMIVFIVISFVFLLFLYDSSLHSNFINTIGNGENSN
jgi:regulator of nonsense transcripts 1